MTTQTSKTTKKISSDSKVELEAKTETTVKKIAEKAIKKTPKKIKAKDTKILEQAPKLDSDLDSNIESELIVEAKIAPKSAKNKKNSPKTAKTITILEAGSNKLSFEKGNKNDNAKNETLDDAPSDALDDILDDTLDEKDDLELEADLEIEPLSFELHDGEALLPALRGISSPAIRDGLYSYMQAISKFPLILPEEEQELARRALNNDKEAAFLLISAHLRLVVKIAMEFQRRWMQNVLDLIQEGNVGLMRAVNKFDPEKGIKFSYYASFWIKAFILKFIMDNWRMVKIGTTQSQRKLFYNLNRERQKLTAQGFNPDPEMLAKHLNVSKEDIIDMEQRLNSQDMSLDISVSKDGEGSSRVEFLPALGPGVEESVASEQISRMVKEKLVDIVHLLSEKEVFILNQRLLADEPVTLREIGERYNITRERVRQIETRLLQKLKAYLTKDIKDFSEDWISQ